jgi:CheY-like chemotaxis protein
VSPHRPIRVLQVEDEPIQAFLTADLLGGASAPGFELKQVVSVREACRQLDETPFDVVLTDLSLPDSRGLQTVQLLREHAHDVPLVVFSGVEDEQLLAKLRSLDIPVLPKRDSGRSRVVEVLRAVVRRRPVP